jgi:hypothetical protein
LSADRGEHADVSTSMPDRLAALAAGLAEYAEHCRQVAPPAHHAARRAEPPDPAATEALQQLGYL